MFLFLFSQTFSLTIAGVSQHLISYYKIEDVEQGRLRTPSSLPELASLDISAEYLDKTHFRNPPKVDYDRDGVPRYRGEADEAEPSPRQTIAVPMPNGQPLLAESRNEAESPEYSGKRSKRYDPYSNTNSGTKRPRKKGSGQATSSDSHSGASQSPTNTVSGQPAPGTGPYAGSDAPYPHYSNVSYYQQGGMYAMPTHPTHLYTPSSSGAPSQAQAQTYSNALPITASPTTESPTSANSVPVPTTSSPPPPQAAGGVSAQGQGAYAGYTSAAESAQSQSAQNYTYYPTQSSHYAPYGGMSWPPTYGYQGAGGLAGVASGSNGNVVGKVEEEETHVGMRPGAQAVAAEARDA